MFILTYSKEIWYVVLSIGFLTLISFLCALLYQFILAAKDVREAAESVKHQVDEVGEIIKSIKKINIFGTYSLIAGSLIKKINKWLQKDKWDDLKTNKKKKDKDKAEKTAKPAETEAETPVFMQDEL